MTKLLCIISRPPYQNSHSLELLETAMVGAVFDFEVSVLFRGEGVWCLLKDQDASTLSQRTLGKVLGALATYEISSLYVCTDALQSRSLAEADLFMPVVSLDFAKQADLIAQQNVVMGAQS